MSQDEIREAMGIAIRHARSTFQSYKSRGLTVAGKVSDILIENTKAAAKEAMLVGSGLVAAGQVAAEMGIEAGKAALEARRERIEEEREEKRELEEFAASLSKPEDSGIPAAK